jgi:uncharacterized protein YheU (UPF0270 family)
VFVLESTDVGKLEVVLEGTDVGKLEVVLEGTDVGKLEVVLESTDVGKLEVVLVLLCKDIIGYEHFLFSFIEITYDAVSCVVNE